MTVASRWEAGICYPAARPSPGDVQLREDDCLWCNRTLEAVGNSNTFAIYQMWNEGLSNFCIKIVSEGCVASVHVNYLWLRPMY